MRLSKLEIYGFKSFAKRTEIIFPQNVTGIVGPNGSGKSNISDAVRWVLGEQSAKNLRGNSMSDVIFNGTEQRKAMNYCEVTLLFDNADHQLPVDFAEVSITRRVYRSGESEYLMNGASCRLRDVVDLFRDTGVGREGYSIIGQGRIDEILSQRSEDRRAVFEEAAGISRFRARKVEAEQRLKRSDENLVRVEDVLEELNRQLAPLSRQAEVAREYQALSDTLRELDIRLYLLRYGRLSKRSATMETALLAVSDQLAELTERLNALQQERQTREVSLEALQKALAEAHEALLGKTDQLHLAQETAQNVDNRLKTGAETLERLQGEEQAVHNRAELIRATLAQSENGLTEAERQRVEADATLRTRKEALTQATEAAQQWEDELTEHKAAIMRNMNRMQDVRTTQARQSAMHTQMSARLQELKDSLRTSENKEQTLRDALMTAKQNLAGELALFETRRAQAETLDAQGRELAEAYQKQQLAAQEMAQSARASETRLKTLRELQDGYEGYQYPVRQALAYARQAGMGGVRNVVAMLLNVPQKFETALDMALGGAMQNIVTDTEQDAKKLIDHLRSNRLGRATFLPLSAVSGRTLSSGERRILSMPGCLGLASELCTFEEKYRPVMESLLGRTVIAEDLDSGIEIMRAGNHAFRLVTLAGDVMHSGGSMTGGSSQQKAQNLLGREREIKELQTTLILQNAELGEATRCMAEMDAQRAALREKRVAAREALQQQEIAVVRDTERQSTANAELNDHLQVTGGVRQAITQLEESLADVELELKRIEAQTGQEQNDADEMNRKTDTLSAKLDQERRAREAAQEAQTQALLALQEAEHNCDGLRRDGRRLLEDSKTCKQDLAALTVKRDKTLLDIHTAKGEQAAAAEAVAAAGNGVSRAKAQVETTEALRAEAQQALRDVQNEIEAGRTLAEKVNERLHRQEMNLSRVKADLTALNDRLWDTYELTYAGAQDAFAEYELLLARSGADSEPSAQDDPDRANGANGALKPADATPGQAHAAAGLAQAVKANTAARNGARNVGEATDEATNEATNEASADSKDDTDADTDTEDGANREAADETAALESAADGTPLALKGFDETAADRQAQDIRERIRRMGNVNVGAIEEYAQLRERANDLTAQRDDLESAKRDLQTLIANLLQHMRTVFVGQFELLQGYFEETFSRLFGGGHGEVRLADPTDPLNCGIDIIVQPPGKKRQILSLFSGGERALTAIAILFAMLKLKPTPFCILDEIEAALDEANISYFADYLKEFSQGTQFVVVTHRKGTMERCDTLFGVAMEERGVSSMVSVSLRDYE